LRRLLPFLVSAGALTWLLTTLELRALVDAVSWNAARVLLPAMIVYGAVTLWIESASILRLVASTAGTIDAWTAARSKCASYLLGIVNYALGAAALTILLRRRAGIGLREAASVVLLISYLDALLLFVLAGLSAASMESTAPAMRRGLVVATIVGLGLVGGLALLRAPVSMGPLERIRSLAIFQALRMTPTRRLGEVALLRLCFAAMFIAVAGSGFFAFGVSVRPTQLVVGIVVVAAVAAMPIAVAGLGTSQLAFVYVFRDLADPEVLLALSLVLSGALISLRATMGLVFAREFTREALEETREEPT
jgi:hypothetical protein